MILPEDGLQKAQPRGGQIFLASPQDNMAQDGQRSTARPSAPKDG